MCHGADYKSTIWVMVQIMNLQSGTRRRLKITNMGNSASYEFAIMGHGEDYKATEQTDMKFI